MNKLLTGFTLGLLVGVLFAPDKGTETRKKIAEKGNEIKDQVADLIDVVACRLETSADEIDEYVEEALEKG
ncbi:MAG: YtxH domain-containing protein [Chitinophagaceae bacterium]|nr:MAG: YtxH domain-containing protein [Chitinophagaceae bacterium]